MLLLTDIGTVKTDTTLSSLTPIIHEIREFMKFTNTWKYGYKCSERHRMRWIWFDCVMPPGKSQENYRTRDCVCAMLSRSALSDSATPRPIKSTKLPFQTPACHPRPAPETY